MRQAVAFSLIFCMTYATALQASEFPFAASLESPTARAFAQSDQQQDYSQDQNSGQDYGSDYQNYSPDQLDNLLAPIALYPDPLLAQVLPAATFVDQIDEATRYVRASGQNGVDDQDWDVSVKAVAHYPAVLYMMSDKIDWTTALGQAYVYQSTDVMASVQRLRALANDQGNLVSNQQQQIIVQPSYIQIWPVQPQYIYVPVYNPAYVYYQRPAYGAFFITFGTGLFIGAWLNRDCDWGGRRIYYTGWNGGGWIGRSRSYVHIQNTVYVNNRYTNITINRTVVHRQVNYNSINRYNSVHRNVNYNNLAVNNTVRNRRPVNNPGNNTRPGTPGNNNRPNNNNRPGNPAPGNKLPPTNNNNRPTNKLPTTQPTTQPTNRVPNNGVIDRNINQNNKALTDYRGRDNPQTRPAARPAIQPAPAARPAVQPAPAARPAPQNNARPATQPSHGLSPRETNFNANQASARGQASRQQAAAPARQPAPQQRSAPAPKPAGKPR